MELAPLLVVVAPFQFLFALAQVADLGGGGGGVVADDDALVLVVLAEALEDHLAVVDLDLYGPALDTRNRSIEKFRFPFSFVLKTFFFIKKRISGIGDECVPANARKMSSSHLFFATHYAKLRRIKVEFFFSIIVHGIALVQWSFR